MPSVRCTRGPLDGMGTHPSTRDASAKERKCKHVTRKHIFKEQASRSLAAPFAWCMPRTCTAHIFAALFLVSFFFLDART